jgi:hypothetical protein
MRMVLVALVRASAVAAALCMSATTAAFADGAWLDQSPPAQWNVAGQDVPAAPQPGPADPRCDRVHRPTETSEDSAVEAAGWVLFDSYESGWGVRLVHGLVGHDGMCRPLDYQTFVFVNGVFAGTTSPSPMNARTDGAESTAVIAPRGDALNAQFARYAETDPFCCPSRISTVTYRIEMDGGTPVLVPGTVYTGPGRP